MTTRFFIAAGLAAVLAGGSAIAAAQAPRGGPGMRGGQSTPGPRAGVRGPDLGLRGIQLTESQREQVRSIMESHRPALGEVNTKLREAHRAFAEAVRAELLDEQTVRARSTDVANAMAEEAILRARIRREVHALLTAEQQQQLQQREAERQKRQAERAQRMKERNQQRQQRPPQ